MMGGQGQAPLGARPAVAREHQQFRQRAGQRAVLAFTQILLERFPRIVIEIDDACFVAFAGHTRRMRMAVEITARQLDGFADAHPRRAQGVDECEVAPLA